MEHNTPGLQVFDDEERMLIIKKALKLRLRGKSYADIGDELGVSSGQAWSYVTKELQKRIKETSEDASEIIRLEVERLDKILEAMWDKVEAGSLDHTETYLRVAQRRSKLLGLDAATRHTVEVKDDRRKFTDKQLYDRFRALQERLAKAGFKPHPVLAERSPFEPAIEGEVVKEPDKVPAGARFPVPVGPNTAPGPTKPEQNEPNAARFIPKPGETESNPGILEPSEDQQAAQEDPKTGGGNE
jgi:hypothetical protein